MILCAVKTDTDVMGMKNANGMSRRGAKMTYSMQMGNRYKMVFSDSAFKPYRKKPTISIYDSEKNCETKIASFNSQDTFEWFVGLMTGEERE